jgi:hypothetical protein
VAEERRKKVNWKELVAAMAGAAAYAALEFLSSLLGGK